MKRTIALLLLLATVFVFSSCGTPGGIAGGTPLSPGTSDTPDTPMTMAATEPLNAVRYDEAETGGYLDDEAYVQKLAAFCNRIYEIAAPSKGGNYAVSPLSLYFALAVLHAIGDAQVKNEIETLFDMTAADVAKTGDLFLCLTRAWSYMGDDVSKLELNNSIWLDTTCTANGDVLAALARDLYCYAFRTPFATDNKQANEDVRAFVKEQTHGLIDSDFDLPPDTLFAIINTLYFKDVWGGNGNLPVAARTFFAEGGAIEKDFLTGAYEAGRVAETALSYDFYTVTETGYRVRFILPKDGVALSAAMSADNLNEVCARTYKAQDESGTEWRTRCIFPKFRIESDTPFKEVLEQNNYLAHTFSGYTSDLTDAPLVVSDIIHKVVLKADEEGIEGAAVTIIVNKATAAMPEPKVQYADFVLDRAFGFVISSPDGVVLFEGQVTQP